MRRVLAAARAPWFHFSDRVQGPLPRILRRPWCLTCCPTAWARSEMAGPRREARRTACPSPANHRALQRRRRHMPGLRRPALRAP
eukprot:2162235-Pyramimonas_sp.AAC.1